MIEKLRKNVLLQVMIASAILALVVVAIIASM